MPNGFSDLSITWVEGLTQRLDIAAGTAVRFEPGEEKEVALVALGGARIVYGHNGWVNGALDDPAVREQALQHVAST